MLIPCCIAGCPGPIMFPCMFIPGIIPFPWPCIMLGWPEVLGIPPMAPLGPFGPMDPRIIIPLGPIISMPAPFGIMLGIGSPARIIPCCCILILIIAIC